MSKYFEKHSATISGLSHDGRGIAHINKKITFIFGALPGESVEFRYTKFHRQFDEGAVLNVLEAAPERVTPRCAFFAICGGCSLQHMDPNFQLQHKEAVLLEHLRHIGQTSPREILPPLQDTLWGYRHRARLSVHDSAKKNKVKVGFREQNSHFVADITRCEVLAPVIGDKIEAFSALLFQLKAKAQIPQIEIAVTEKISALVIRHLVPLCEDDLAKIEAFAKDNHFTLYLQPKGSSSIHLYPEKENFALEYEIPAHQLNMQFQPWQFTQINPRVNVKMIDRALELLEPQENERILDLFCGIGNFTLPLARYCQQVVGVEGDNEAVQQARKNAQLNSISNAEFFTANLFENCEGAAWASRTHYDKILLDPPRAGAQEIMPLLKRFNAPRIVYVSCNSATLARDIKILVEMGYNLEKAGIMDMFPHTQHAESIALLRKK